MTLKDIFERVNIYLPLEQKKFFMYLNSTIEELETMYSKFLFEKENDERKVFLHLEDSYNVLPLYTDAIVENILYLGGRGDIHKSEFIRKAQETHLKYWRERAKNVHIKRGGW